MRISKPSLHHHLVTTTTKNPNLKKNKLTTISKCSFVAAINFHLWSMFDAIFHNSLRSLMSDTVSKGLTISLVAIEDNGCFWKPRREKWRSKTKAARGLVWNEKYEWERRKKVRSNRSYVIRHMGNCERSTKGVAFQLKSEG